MAGINPEVTGKKPAQAPSKRVAPKAEINPGKKPAQAPSKRRRLMFRKEVMEFFKCSSPTIWNWIQRKGFPRPLVIEGRDGWFEDEIMAWVESKPRRRFKGDAATNAPEETSREAAGD